MSQNPDLALVPRTEAPQITIFSAPVADDTALWVAWNGAQTAWLESKRRKSGSENTVRAYTLACRQFFQFALVAPWAISSVHAYEWAADLTAKGASEATLGLKLAALSSFYDFVQCHYPTLGPDGHELFLWGADRANPFKVVGRPKITPYGRATFPATDELLAILAHINTNCLTGKRDFALLYTISTTCRRCSEILHLKWGDIKPGGDGHYWFTYRCKGGKYKKAHLDRRAFSAICVYLNADGRPPETLTPESYIFIPLFPDRIIHLPSYATRTTQHESIEAHPISNHQANAILKKYARRAGVSAKSAHIHGLRHAGAHLRVEQMAAAGRSPDYMELMELLGHSNIATTQIYCQAVHEHPTDPGGEAAADALLPKGPHRRRRKSAATQERLL